MAHKFAIFIPKIIIIKSKINIKDLVTYRRIVNILRLKQNSLITAFDLTNIYECLILEINNKEIVLEITSDQEIKYIEPYIDLAIGLLKKDDFEQAITNATILGIRTIQPIITDLTHRNWWSEKFKIRFESLMIAACEQSKNFAIPKIDNPLTLTDWLKQLETNYLLNNILLCDPTGQSLYKEIINKNNNYIILIGPEAGFSEKELNLFTKFKKVALTPTVLKSVDAVLVSGGILRNILTN